jgi:hypothetical protein
MPRINEPASGHGRITSPAGNRYWEYSNASSLKILKQAISIINRSVKGMRTCNNSFNNLPNSRSFDDVWADNSVWINYEDRTDRGWYGITLGVGGTEISISESAFKIGVWTVAGTLIHELAHVNGARPDTADAEKTLIPCGLRNVYTGVIGALDTSSSDYLYAADDTGSQADDQTGADA